MVLLGLVSYQRLTVREYPNIDPPVVTVNTTYPGASAEIVEIAGHPGARGFALRHRGHRLHHLDQPAGKQPDLRSASSSARYRDPDGAAADVRDRVARVRARLPDEIDEPVIQKVEADAQPIIYLAFFSDRHSPLEITDYADRFVKDRLQTLPGVAEVRIFGERRYSMRIWLDPERLAAYGLTPQDVEDALRRQNVEVPAGRIESQQREFTVLSRDRPAQQPSSSTISC